VIGGLCLLLACGTADAAHQLRRSGADPARIAFFIGEAFVPSFGALGLGGVAAFAFGHCC